MIEAVLAEFLEPISWKLIFVVLKMCFCLRSIGGSHHVAILTLRRDLFLDTSNYFLLVKEPIKKQQ